MPYCRILVTRRLLPASQSPTGVQSERRFAVEINLADFILSIRTNLALTIAQVRCRKTQQNQEKIDYHFSDKWSDVILYEYLFEIE
jgi:hypothetical protein